MAIEVGKMNRLRVDRVVDFGVYLMSLDASPSSEAEASEKREGILLPSRYIPDGLEVDDQIAVFVYADSEDRLLATTETPKAMAGEAAFLRVVAVNRTGTFLDWGLPKDLMLPYGEQKRELEPGQFCAVFVYKDKYSERVVASTRLNRHIGLTPAYYKPGEQVDIMVVARTDLGHKVIVNNEHWGLLYENEIFKALRNGLKTKAWVKKVVNDDKVDLTLSPPISERFSTVADQVLKAIEANDGFLPLTDKSSPEAIRRRFGISKRDFKAAVGKLYKLRMITIEADGLYIKN
ncbi:MAG: S1-like domain-containing RNA-binding protein [Xanthomonadales bacterium]|nr:S1-like domain-containing RNA-binding protein [Xanthomonadales bacterium]